MLALLLIAAWEPIMKDGSLTVEGRPAQVNGRQLKEIRVSAHTKATPEQFGETLWKHHEYVQFVPHLKKLEVLSTEGNRKLVYQQAKMPVVQDRDYVLQVDRSWDPQTRVYESVFKARSDTGPAPNGDHVRVGLIQGRWTVAPAESGGSDVMYQILTDPGDSIPQWVLNLAQKGAVADLVKAMIARCETTHK